MCVSFHRVARSPTRTHPQHTSSSSSSSLRDDSNHLRRLMTKRHRSPLLQTHCLLRFWHSTLYCQEQRRIKRDSVVHFFFIFQEGGRRYFCSLFQFSEVSLTALPMPGERPHSIVVGQRRKKKGESNRQAVLGYCPLCMPCQRLSVDLHPYPS